MEKHRYNKHLPYYGEHYVSSSPQRLAWKTRKSCVLSVVLYCIATAVFLLNILFLALKYHPATLTSIQPYIDSPANATLGFGAIYAVSRKGSPRRQSLERAAELTGLNIKIPSQPTWESSDIEAIIAPENTTMTRGSALAWLGHMNALKRFLDSPYETALIVEDDVDYDTHIRTEQIPATAYAIRELLESQDRPEYYYGDPSLWDILWLGHCGDYFDFDQAERRSSPIKIFTDITLPLLAGLHPWTRNFLEEIGASDDQQRLVYRSVNPLCTFAYAVTRASAERIVYEYAALEPGRPLHRPCVAYDVRLLEACRDDGFSCITVSPELFHHTAAPSEIARATEGILGGLNDQTTQETPNIRCPARSDLWWNSRRRPYDSPSLQDRGKVMSDLAQEPGSCFLDTMRPGKNDQ